MTMCRVHDISVNSCYARTQHPENDRKQKNLKIMTAIKENHKQRLETYESPGIEYALQKRSFQYSCPRTARLMRESVVRAKCAKKFKVMTDSNHNEPIEPNHLAQEFTIETPFKV